MTEHCETCGARLLNRWQRARQRIDERARPTEPADEPCGDAYETRLRAQQVPAEVLADDMLAPVEAE